MDFDPNIIVIAIIAVAGLITASKLGKYWISTNTKPDTIENMKKEFREQLKLKDESLEMYKKLYQRWKGRASMQQLPPQVEGNPDDLESVIPKLIESYKGIAPAWAKPLLETPGISNFLINEAKKHPDDAKRIISAFFRPGKDQSQDQQQSELPGQFA